MKNLLEISEKLLEKANDTVLNNSSRLMLYSAAFNFETPENINFAALDIDELIYFKDNVYEIIQSEDEDGELTLDKNHPFAQLISLQHKMFYFENAPMQRLPSLYRFI